MTWNRLLLAAMAAVIVYLSYGLYEEKYRDRGRLAVIARGDHVVLVWGTRVDVPMRTRFQEAFDKWRERTDHFVIQLHSPGGSLREGRELIELIERIKRTHRVDTFVAGGDICASMCVPIYLQGQSRVAGRDARFMFHEPYRLGGAELSRKSQPDWEQRGLSQRFFERYFVNSPMTPAWRRHLEKAWIGKDIWKTAQELSQEKSGIITDLR
jgi:hypothetical protein